MPAIIINLTINEFFEAFRIRRVSPLDQAIEDQIGHTAHQKYLMPVLRLPFALNDDIGMGLEQRNDLLRGRNLLVLQYPSFRLIHDLPEQVDNLEYFFCQVSSPDHIERIVATFIFRQNNRRGFSVAADLVRIPQHVFVGGFTDRFAFRVLDGEQSLFDNPAVIGKPVPRLR